MNKLEYNTMIELSEKRIGRGGLNNTEAKQLLSLLEMAQDDISDFIVLTEDENKTTLIIDTTNNVTKNKILVIFDNDMELKNLSDNSLREIIIPFFKELNNDYYTHTKLIKRNVSSVEFETNSFTYELSTNRNLRGKRYLKIFIDFRMDYKTIYTEILPSFTSNSNSEHKYFDPFEFEEVKKSVVDMFHQILINRDLEAEKLIKK